MERQVTARSARWTGSTVARQGRGAAGSTSAGLVPADAEAGL